LTSTLGDEEKGKSKSKAWIAGAVVGPIIGLALIGLAAFFLMRRKKSKSHNQHIASVTGGMPAPGATAYQQNTYLTNPASPGPPQYHPNMQQNAGAAPLGVAKQDNYYGQGTNPVSPITSQGSQSPYSAPPQQWQQPGGQPVYGAPSPSMSPAPQNVQPAQYVASEARPFSSELEGSYDHGKPQLINVQPKKWD
jgi:LPXTG-motif cell wall-anchored protein